MNRIRPLREACLAALVAAATTAHAQAPAPAEEKPASAPSEAAKPAPGTKPPGVAPSGQAKPETPAKVQTLEVTGTRTSTTDRRDSTAAKIVIGREEIEQYGDSNLGDVLRRLPGVTQGGRPGRGGPVRFRGLGGGFTQFLINGERIPPGFSIEDITPEQVERIEILRAPTAETGTRAIAGTINIILREALHQRRNDIRAGIQSERGRETANTAFTRNDSFSETGTYNLTVSTSVRDQSNDAINESIYRDVASNQVALAQRSDGQSVSKGESVFSTLRTQWRLGPGEQFSFQPFGVASNNHTTSRDVFTQSVGVTAPPYATGESKNDSQFRSGRFMTMLNKRLDPKTTYELRGGAGVFTVGVDGRRQQFDATGARTLLEETSNDIRDASWNVAGKVARSWGETHRATAGIEWEQTNRSEKPLTRINGEVQLAEFGSELDVRVKRAAAFIQDEWDPNPQWSTSVGLRWEAIETTSDAPGNPVNNRSSVVNPLAAAVWRFDGGKRDQLRASLTQSYRPPTTQNLVARPRLNTLYPVPGPNTPITADSAGNPSLQPEVANGLELAIERYLSANGVISLNVFTRQLTDVIRNVTALESVSWATSPRWVSRPQNFGKASTSGLEFDAKFQLREIIKGAPPVNLRANFSAFKSQVDGVPGPDNRLASQPDMTANLGGDYRFPGTPFSVGASYNWTPAYDSRVTEQQLERIQRKSVLDAYLLWHFSASGRLRFAVTNTDPTPTVSETIFTDGGVSQAAVNSRKGGPVYAIRLEMRL